MNYKKYITIDSKIRFGKPVVVGTRITVYDVLHWLSTGMSTEEIIYDYPELTSQKINACLAFAAERENRIRVA